MNADNSTDDRRRAPRKAAVLAVAMSSAAKPNRTGVTRDVSERGILVVTPSRFASGDRVTVTVHAGAADFEARGRVARVDENSVSSPELWRYRLAIVLDAPLPADVLDRAS